jgi:hypothetical protein
MADGCDRDMKLQAGAELPAVQLSRRNVTQLALHLWTIPHGTLTSHSPRCKLLVVSVIFNKVDSFSSIRLH